MFMLYMWVGFHSVPESPDNMTPLPGRVSEQFELNSLQTHTCVAAPSGGCSGQLQTGEEAEEDGQ